MSFPKEYDRVERIVSENLAGQKFVFSVDRARRIVEEFRAVYIENRIEELSRG